MTEFKVGDRVKTKEDVGVGNGCVKNQKGVVKYSSESNSFIGIEFDEHINGHSGNNIDNTGSYGKDGYCWNVNPENMELVSELKDFTHIKVKVSDEEESRKVQEAMFEREFEWSGSGKVVKHYIGIYPGHLYFDDKYISYTNASSEDHFKFSSHKEITVNDILMKGGKEKVEFKVGDRVRRINVNHPSSGLKIGDIGIVRYVWSDSVELEDHSSHLKKNIELVSKATENKMGTNRTLYHVTAIDRRNSSVVVDVNVAAVNEYAAVLKAMDESNEYDVEDIDHYHYQVSTVATFESEDHSDCKKK